MHLLSDRTRELQGEPRVRVIGLDGEVLRDERQTVTLPPLSSALVAGSADAELLGNADPAATAAVFDLQAEGEPPSRRVVWSKTAKELRRDTPGLRVDLKHSGSGYVLTLRSERIAHAVWIEFGGLDVELADNALTVLPGESVAVRLTSAAGPDALRSALNLRSLADAVQSVSR